MNPTVPFDTYDDLICSGAGHDEPRVLVERSGSTATVRLTDPSSGNAFGVDQAVQLREAVSALALDRSARTVILTGDGSIFSTGGHLGLMDQAVEPMIQGPEGAVSLWRWLRNEYGSIARVMTTSDTLFIAAVNGVAAGVAFPLIFNCDVVLAGQSATFVSGFARIGLVPEAGGAWLLTRRLGYHGAFDLLTSGRPLRADDALDLGLVSAVFPDGELMSGAEAKAEQLERLPSHVVSMTKAVLRQGADLTWHQAIAMEEFAQPLCFSSQAHRDAVSHLVAEGGVGTAERSG